jgi:NhaD family Na+/H+ antiporter
MDSLIAIVFILGYAAIALEHPLRMNKSATAVLLAVFCWLLYMIGNNTDHDSVLHQLSEHLSGIAEILFFLMGAMAIVELIDSHKGFRIVANLIRTDSTIKLLWIISIITFFLSAILNNMTTAIVMVSLLKRLIEDKEDRKIMAGMVIIAANAGGAWSPIGDVTTTMLWIGGQVSPVNILKELFLPSLISFLVPLIYQTFLMKIQAKEDKKKLEPIKYSELLSSESHSSLVLFLGAGVLIFIPVFKAITNLPPYMGMLFGLGILWAVTEFLHSPFEERKHLRVSHVLSRIDLTSLMFFLGILLAVAALESIGILQSMASWLDHTIADKNVIIITLGLLSSVIDNVPLVAATMGMYPISQFPLDHKIWEMIAYCAGTGGSILIIGSAAGVVVMGMEKIEFFWYVKRISFTALLGYFAGVFIYLLMIMLQGN